MTDDRLYIKVHNGMPDHPKIEPLSDAAFRAYVQALCLCAKFAPDGRLNPMVLGRKRVRAELEAAGLVERDGMKYRVCDLDGEPWTTANVVRINGRTGMSAAVKERVLRRDGEMCNHCGATEGPWHIDHIHPVARGGTSALGNLQVLCGPCNRHKGTLLPAEWDRFTDEHGRRGTCGRCA